MNRSLISLLVAAALITACGANEKGAVGMSQAPSDTTHPTMEQKVAAQRVRVPATAVSNLDFEGGTDANGFPTGWSGGGLGYQFAVSNDAPHGGKGSFALKWNKAMAPDSNDWATLTQCTMPEQWKGKRLQLSGFVKSVGIDSGSGLWMRVDGPEAGKALGFDNMLGRGIRGTTEWKSYSVVLDVPETATMVCYGVVMVDRGALWADDLTLTVVGNDVPVTAMAAPGTPKP